MPALNVQGQFTGFLIRCMGVLNRVLNIDAARNPNCALKVNGAALNVNCAQDFKAALNADCALTITGAAIFHQMLNINCVLKVNGETRGRSGTSGATW